MDELESLEAERKQLVEKFESDVRTFLKMTPSQQSDKLYADILISEIVIDCHLMTTFNCSVKVKIGRFYVELHELERKPAQYERKVRVLQTFNSYVRFSDYTSDTMIAVTTKYNGASVGGYKIISLGGEHFMITRPTM